MNGLLSIVAAPNSAVVTLAEAKRHCVVETDETQHDDLLQGFIDAATETVAEHCGLVLAPASYLYRLPHWCNPMLVPLSPVRDVTRVAYLDSDGVEHDLGADEWQAEIVDDAVKVHLTEAFTAPALRLGRHAVRVYVDAGYDDPAQSGSGDEAGLRLPVRIKLAINAIVASWFEHRETVLTDQTYRNSLAEALLAQLRVYR